MYELTGSRILDYKGYLNRHVVPYAYGFTYGALIIVAHIYILPLLSELAVNGICLSSLLPSVKGIYTAIALITALFYFRYASDSLGVFGFFHAFVLPFVLTSYFLLILFASDTLCRFFITCGSLTLMRWCYNALIIGTRDFRDRLCTFFLSTCISFILFAGASLGTVYITIKFLNLTVISHSYPIEIPYEFKDCSFPTFWAEDSHIRLLGENTYYDLDEKEKLQCLGKLLDYILSIYGISPSNTYHLKIQQSNKDHTLGCYCYGDRTLTIKSFVLDSQIQTFEVFFHEVYHLLQHEKLSGKLADTLPIPEEQLDLWAYEFDNYISGSDGDYQDYADQNIEMTARAFSYRMLFEFTSYLKRMEEVR